MAYYHPPCSYCNINFSIYNRNKIPMICKKCTTTCCYLCSDRGRSCPNCFERWTVAVNMLLVDNLKETEPHNSTQTPVIIIDWANEDFSKLPPYPKKKKCIIM